jgi:hypothetical protein
MAAKIVFFMGVVASALLMAKTPDVPAYERILKQDMSKGAQNSLGTIPLPSPPPPIMAGSPAPLSPPPSIGGEVGFNVIGTMSVNGKSTAWLINKENKIIRAGVGVVVDGKEIQSINQYGVQFKGAGSGGFLPIMTTMVSEQDVVFKNRDAQQSSNNNGMAK